MQNQADSSNLSSSGILARMKSLIGSATQSSVNLPGPAQVSASPTARPASFSPPDGILKPLPAAPAPESLARVETWERGDKGLRGVANEDQRGQEKAPGAVTITADFIIKERRAVMKRSTEADLRHGKLCNLWVRSQPERPENEQLDRPSAIKALTRFCKAGKLDTKSCRVNRFIGCYHVAMLFGGDVLSLTITAIRTMIPLIKRDPKTDRWSIVPETAEAAKSLWQRMLAEHLTEAVVMAEVRKILYPDPLPLEVERKKSRLPRLLKTFSEYSVEELKLIIKAAKAEINKSLPASAAAPSGSEAA